MITKKAEYAIIILAELAAHPHGKKITSKEIARNRNISGNVVTQLLSILKEAGWTSGTRGPAGGVEMIADPGQINLRQVIELVDGPIGITRCLFNDAPCNNQVQCSLRGIWAKAQKNMLAVLEEVSVQDLAKALTSQ